MGIDGIDRLACHVCLAPNIDPGTVRSILLPVLARAMDRLDGKQDIRSPSPPRPLKKWSDSPAFGNDGDLPTVDASRQSIGADAERLHSFPGLRDDAAPTFRGARISRRCGRAVGRMSIPSPVWCEQGSPHESEREDVQAKPRSDVDRADSGAVRRGRRDGPMERDATQAQSIRNDSFPTSRRTR